MRFDRMGRGGVAGVVATIPMSAVIAAGRAAGLMRTPPPKQITANAEAAAGVDGTTPEGFTARWALAHLAYGAACGVCYAAAAPRLPALALNPIPAGLAYGGAVWAASYCAVMPALGLFPWPWDDDRSRAAVMVVAHGVFGIALARVSLQLDAIGE